MSRPATNRGRRAAVRAALAALLLPAALVAQTSSVQEALLEPGVPPGSIPPEWGSDVALEGDLLAVGAPGSSVASLAAGAVFLFERDGVDWLPLEPLVADAPSPANSSLGFRVDIDGDRIAALVERAVLVFREQGGAWVQEQQLPLFPPGALSAYTDLALDGDTLAVAGAHLGGTERFVDMFEFDGASWSFTERLDLGIVNLPPAIELTGDTLFVGVQVSQLDFGKLISIQAIQVWERNAGAWSQIDTLVKNTADSLDLDGERLVATGRYIESENLSLSDPSYFETFTVVYARDGAGTWGQQQKLAVDDALYPRVVAVSGDALVVAGLDADDALHVLRYAEGDAGWQQQEAFMIDGLRSDFLRVTTDGDRYAVGLPGLEAAVEDAGAAVVLRDTPFGGIEAGALAGAGGVTPQLAGAGTVASGGAITLALTDALPSSQTNLLAGLAQLGAPFKGGVLVPTPDLILQGLLGLPVDAAGGLELAATLPADLPSGLRLYLQHWVVDPAGPLGFSASNGLEVAVP